MPADDDGSRVRVRLDPPTLHAPRGDVVAAVTLGTGVTGGVAIAAFAPVIGVVVGTVGAVGGIAAIAYPWQRLRIHDLRLKRRMARIRRDAPQPIAKARTGTVHVRGRVHVLEPVPHGGTGESVAAYVRRDRLHTRCTCTETCTAWYQAIRTEWATGRFALVDESGVAVVDGGVVDLWPTDASLYTDDELALRHGDLVDVLGPAQPVDAPDVATLVPSTYRARSEPTGFVGSVEHPVTIVVPS